VAGIFARGRELEDWLRPRRFLAEHPPVQLPIAATRVAGAPRAHRLAASGETQRAAKRRLIAALTPCGPSRLRAGVSSTVAVDRCTPRPARREVSRRE
jgi:hypothetical protein